MTIKWNILKPNWWRLQHVNKTSPHMTFTSGLEAWICLEDVLTHWSLLCDYAIKYFKGPLVTSSTRHVHKTTKKTTRRPVLMAFVSGLEAWMLLEDVMMRSSRLWSSYQIQYVKPLGYVFNTSYLCKKAKLVAIINRPKWVFRAVWQYIKNLTSALEATFYADISCDLKLNLSRNSLPNLLLTPCRRDMYVDDTCTLTMNFIGHHNQLKVYLITTYMPNYVKNIIRLLA